VTVFVPDKLIAEEGKNQEGLQNIIMYAPFDADQGVIHVRQISRNINDNAEFEKVHQQAGYRNVERIDCNILYGPCVRIRAFKEDNNAIYKESYYLVSLHFAISYHGKLQNVHYLEEVLRTIRFADDQRQG
jgi:hypothetical protein